MSKVNLPGLVDVHVHLREPGATHKEDWDSGTAAALAGGFTTILAMPNTQPPVTDSTSFSIALKAAQNKARCDFGQFLGAAADNAEALVGLSPHAAGLKMYLDQTYGRLRLEDIPSWIDHFKHWPRHLPVVAHAEGRTLATVILVAVFYQRKLHLAHVSRREEILLIRLAKEKGFNVTCEVTPHHLFLTEKDIPVLGEGVSEVRPRLATIEDQYALWENLEVIDCFASDHAPHTVEEKMGPNPPPGFPGLETALPLLLTAVAENRLSIDELISRFDTSPREIFHLPESPETWIEIDLGETWKISASDLYTRCAWTPFDGLNVQGRVHKVVLRGKIAFQNGCVLAPCGSGKNIRD